MKKIFENFIKKAKKANKYEDKNIDVYPSSGFVIKNENNEWIKNRTNIKKEIEEQKSSVKTINFSTQIEKNKNSKVEKMKICPHCGFVFEDDKNYWLINRTELLVKIAEQKAKEEATKNAREAAEKFARDSGSRVGKIQSATQGLFSIDDAATGMEYKKTVRVVTTVVYGLSD